jgi:membrane dipeptidase
LLPANGGVIMVTFVEEFIAGKFWMRGGNVGATVIEVADHIDHIRSVAGIDHIGIGGDYDGVDKLPKYVRRFI